LKVFDNNLGNALFKSGDFRMLCCYFGAWKYLHFWGASGLKFLNFTVSDWVSTDAILGINTGTLIVYKKGYS
jgi:hypothetical protein